MKEKRRKVVKFYIFQEVFKFIFNHYLSFSSQSTFVNLYFLTHFMTFRKICHKWIYKCVHCPVSPAWHEIFFYLNYTQKGAVEQTKSP